MSRRAVNAAIQHELGYRRNNLGVWVTLGVVITVGFASYAVHSPAILPETKVHDSTEATSDIAKKMEKINEIQARKKREKD